MLDILYIVDALNFPSSNLFPMLSEIMNPMVLMNPAIGKRNACGMLCSDLVYRHGHIERVEKVRDILSVIEKISTSTVT